MTDDVEKLLKELDVAIELITIAKAQRNLIFLKGVVNYVKAMAPADVKSTWLRAGGG